MHDFTGFMIEPIKEFMKEIVDMLKNKSGGKGFRDVDLGEIQELIDTTSEEVTEHDLMEMSVSESVPANEEKRREGSSARKKTDIRQSGRSISIIQDCFNFFYNMDPSMKQAVKLQQMMEDFHKVNTEGACLYCLPLYLLHPFCLCHP